MIFRKESKFTGTYLYIKDDGDESIEVKEDITGLISLMDGYKDQGIKSREIKSFLKSLSDEGKRLEAEDKDMNGWILEPEGIFENQSSESNRYKFFYYPVENSVINEKDNEVNMLNKKLTSLFEYILWHIDYDDDEAVRVSYEAYMRIIRGNYVFEDLWN